MDLPIEKKLVDNVQIEIARLQDNCIETIYSLDPSAVLHGGTAIWRCYGGNRFSDDIDLYLRNGKRIADVRKNLSFALNKYGVIIVKATVIGNSSVFTVRKDSTEVKIEITNNKKKTTAIEKNYERANGSYMSILTLSTEDFILEKMDAYYSRMYIRDMYDIYHLSNLIISNPRLSKRICRFLDNAKSPVDESSLKSIVYAGAAPSFESMVKSIRGHFCEVH